MEKIKTLFISDIKIGDQRSSYQMIEPLMEDIHANHGGVVLFSPENLLGEKLFEVITFKTFFYKSSNNLLRLISEIFYPVVAILKFIKKIKSLNEVENVIVYSPSIFFVFFICFLKCLPIRKKRYYLILRDIFPDWAYNNGFIKNPFVIFSLRKVAALQFKLYDCIGVQNESSKKYLFCNYSIKCKIVVLSNWFSVQKNSLHYNELPKSLQKIIDVKRKYLVYTGSLGHAQDMLLFVKSFCKIIDLNPEFNYNLIILGEGVDFIKIEQLARKYSKRIFIFKKVDNNISNYFIANSSGGIVSLDRKFKVDNIPGKFINYISLGIPVFALVNKSNTDLINEINENRLGIASSAHTQLDIMDILLGYCRIENKYSNENIKNYFLRHYSYGVCSRPLLEWLDNNS